MFGKNDTDGTDAADGLLSGSDFSADDRAASICPVGVILPKHQGFDKPIGERRFDRVSIDQELSHER
jgi:[NiFe] hydrogenase diaphorase moiety small subunit